MNAWWEGLSGLNRTLYGVAVFFSVLFVWQLMSALFGLSGEDGLADAGAADGELSDVSADNASETMTAFTVLNVRSIVTFLTLFTWGSALYLNSGRSVPYALGVSSVWGLVGMGVVAGMFCLLPRLAHTGTRDLNTAVGATGQVYLDIPENGTGEIRVEISGILSHARARAADGRPVRSGTPVVVTRRLGGTTLEVEVVQQATAQQEGRV